MAGCKVKFLFCDGGGGRDGDAGDKGNIMGGRIRRGRMKGGAATTTALSNFDVNVTGRSGRDECAMGDSPA